MQSCVKAVAGIVGLVGVLYLSGCSRVIARSYCESYPTLEEHRACERGQMRATDQNWNDRLRRAERQGYEVHRERYRY